MPLMTQWNDIIFLDLKLRDRFKFKASVIVSFCLIKVMINAYIIMIYHADGDWNWTGRVQGMAVTWSRLFMRHLNNSVSDAWFILKFDYQLMRCSKKEVHWIIAEIQARWAVNVSKTGCLVSKERLSWAWK